MTHHTDQELIKRSVGGEDEAFAVLVDRYKQSVFGLCVRFVRDRDDAEDMAQDAFVKAFLALPKSKSDMPFKPWIMQIAANTCRNFLKKKRPMRFSQVFVSEGDEQPEEDIPDTQMLPDEELDSRYTQDAVREALKKVKEHEKIILTLRYSDDLSYDEISQLMSLPLNTVRTRLRRAKTALAQELTSLDH